MTGREEWKEKREGDIEGERVEGEMERKVGGGIEGDEKAVGVGWGERWEEELKERVKGGGIGRDENGKLKE